MRAEDFVSKILIEKGWSSDQKYCATDAAGTKYLLRLSPIQRSENRKALFDVMQQLAALGIPMCEALSVETCGESVAMVFSWINGEDVSEVLQQLPEAEQYALGFQSGEILRKIHRIPAPQGQEDWAKRFRRKVKRKIKTYRNCGIRFEGDKYVIRYVRKNKRLLKDRPQCFQHGDYHIGNMMLEDGKLRIIDFDRYDFGDPWEDFNRIVWCAQKSPQFATGMINCYFDSEPPMKFWKLLCYYIASNALSSVYWAIPFGQGEIDVMLAQAQDILRWFDRMRNPVPAWYLRN